MGPTNGGQAFHSLPLIPKGESVVKPGSSLIIILGLVWKVAVHGYLANPLFLNGRPWTATSYDSLIHVRA